MRLPKEYRFPGDKVFVKRVGEAIVLLPHHTPWQTLFDSLDLFSDDFMTERNQPSVAEAEAEREVLFP